MKKIIIYLLILLLVGNSFAYDGDKIIHEKQKTVRVILKKLNGIEKKINDEYEGKLSPFKKKGKILALKEVKFYPVKKDENIYSQQLKIIVASHKKCIDEYKSRLISLNMFNIKFEDISEIYSKTKDKRFEMVMFLVQHFNEKVKDAKRKPRKKYVPPTFSRKKRFSRDANSPQTKRLPILVNGIFIKGENKIALLELDIPGAKGRQRFKEVKVGYKIPNLFKVIDIKNEMVIIYDLRTAKNEVYKVKQSGNKKIKYNKDSKSHVNFAVNNMDYQTYYKMLANVANENIIISRNIKGKKSGKGSMSVPMAYKKLNFGRNLKKGKISTKHISYKNFKDNVRLVGLKDEVEKFEQNSVKRLEEIQDDLEPLTISVNNQPITTLLKLISKRAKLELSYGENVSGTVTLSLKKISPKKAIFYICELMGYRVIFNGNAVSVE